MASDKLKPCTKGGRHSWEFVRNVTLRRSNLNARGTTVHVSYRGLYRCECGEVKHGRSQ